VVVSPSSNPRPEEPPPAGCPQMLIQYTGLVKIMLTLIDYNNHLFPAKCVSGL